MGLFDFVYKIAKIAEIAEPIINFITDDGETDSNFSISSEDVSELIGECDSFFNTISKLSLDEENDIIMCLDHIDRRIIKIDSISTISYDDCISNELTRIQDTREKIYDDITNRYDRFLTSLLSESNSNNPDLWSATNDTWDKYNEKYQRVLEYEAERMIRYSEHI